MQAGFFATALAMTLTTVPTIATAQAAADGGTLFRQRCQVCHAAAGAGGPAGPKLAGVVGRKAASTAYSYSPALKKSGLTWTKAELDAYLLAPQKKVPGTRMIVAVPDAGQRAAILGYLTGLK